MKPMERLYFLSNELRKLLKPIVAAAALIGGGLVPFMQLFGKHIQSPQAIAIAVLLFLIVVLVMLCWRLANPESSSGWSDREYLLIKCQWKYTLNKDGESLDGECIAERELVCKNAGISHIPITLDKDEVFLPFNPNENYSTQLIDFHRSGGGAVNVTQPYKSEGASFAFRINFDPPLETEERARVKFKYTVPKFKIATIEELRAKTQNAKNSARDYEFNSFRVIYPIKRFVYEVVFADECKIRPLGLEVVRGTTRFDQEERDVVKNNYFKAECNDFSCRLLLDRPNPPIKAKYLIKWQPPARELLHKNGSKSA